MFTSTFSRKDNIRPSTDQTGSRLDEDGESRDWHIKIKVVVKKYFLIKSDEHCLRRVGVLELVQIKMLENNSDKKESFRTVSGSIQQLLSWI